MRITMEWSEDTLGHVTLRQQTPGNRLAMLALFSGGQKTEALLGWRTRRSQTAHGFANGHHPE